MIMAYVVMLTLCILFGLFMGFSLKKIMIAVYASIASFIAYFVIPDQTTNYVISSVCAAIVAYHWFVKGEAD